MSHSRAEFAGSAAMLWLSQTYGRDGRSWSASSLPSLHRLALGARRASRTRSTGRTPLASACACRATTPKLTLLGSVTRCSYPAHTRGTARAAAVTGRHRRPRQGTQGTSLGSSNAGHPKRSGDNAELSADGGRQCSRNGTTESRRTTARQSGDGNASRAHIAQPGALRFPVVIPGIPCAQSEWALLRHTRGRRGAEGMETGTGVGCGSAISLEWG